MFGIGVPELILILVVGLIVFGPGKLPEMGRSLGQGIREFRKPQGIERSDSGDQCTRAAACAAYGADHRPARTDGTGDDGSNRRSTDPHGNTDRSYRSGGSRGA